MDAVKEGEGRHDRVVRRALYALIISLIAVCCLVGVAQGAYADTIDNADPGNQPASTSPDGNEGTTGTTNGLDGDDAVTNTGTTSTTPENNGTSGDISGIPSGDQAGSRGTIPEDAPTADTPEDPNPADPIEYPLNKPTKAGWMQDVDGTWYYFAAVNAAPKTGWVKSGGKWYWMQPDQNGAMATNQWIVDNGKRYYVDANGVMRTGWFKIGDDWYYANKSGVQQMGGWVKSSGKWYWLLADQDGKMAANMWITDQGKRYHLNASGAMGTKWIQIGGDWYYANKSGAQQMSGWVKSGKKWYWLQGDQEGKMAANTWITDQGKRYYLGASGAMGTKWIQIGNDWYYANKSGAQQMSGWVKSGSKWYWLQGDKDGAMLANALKEIDGTQYSFADNGAMRANCRIDLGNNIVGYAAGSGAISRIGEYKDGALVLTNSEGAILTGWQKMAGKWFYGDPESGIAQTGWLKLGSTWYYLDSNGAMVTGTRTIDGKTHIFNGSGKWLGTDAMVSKAQGYSSGTNWLILVDRGAHRVGVFHGSQGNWNREKQWSCVTGAPGSPTITGVFRTTGAKRMNLSTDSRARWCTQISGGYFFHTILASESELGNSLSHGCIRLALPNAQWIYNNIGAGTTVVIYN